MLSLTNPFHLLVPPWGRLKLEKDRHGIIILDRKQIYLGSLVKPISGKVVYVCGIPDSSLELLCALVKTTRMDFCWPSFTDLRPLRQCKQLRHLAIRDNTKLRQLVDLRGLPLESLILQSTRRLHDLSPVQTLRKLRHFEFGGGWGKSYVADSLEPLSKLPRLERLHLLNLRVKRKGLTPLANCKKLKVLELPNQFPTEQFALLAAKLPRTKCDLFAPWVSSTCPGVNVMITGSRMPFLHSKRDRARIRKYEERFEQLRASFLRTSP